MRCRTEEAKDELDTERNEIRKLIEWHHYMLTFLFGHFFLWHLKGR